MVMQGQLWGAAALFAVSWMAGWADDMLLSEIPGSNSYLIGMGIAGGLTTFTNPLQGDRRAHWLLHLPFQPSAAVAHLPDFA